MDLKIRNVQRTRSQLISELKLTREIQQKNDILTRDEEWWYNKAALWFAKIYQETTAGGLWSLFTFLSING